MLVIVHSIFYYFCIYGIGKTTYCRGMQLYMEAIGRKCIIVNLDFANDTLPYVPAINVCDLITIEVFNPFHYASLQYADNFPSGCNGRA